ncbi:oxidoreductase, partial [Acinetobacter baumannii]
MQLCKYYPVANDRMGSIWTLCSIKDTCIIEFGPAGTTHYAVEGIGSLNAGEGSRIYSTHMDQSDVTFG